MIGERAEGRGQGVGFGVPVEGFIPVGVASPAEIVIPAKAVIHFDFAFSRQRRRMDPGFRRDDGYDGPPFPALGPPVTP